jgi:hypothetical protein
MPPKLTDREIRAFRRAGPAFTEENKLEIAVKRFVELEEAETPVQQQLVYRAYEIDPSKFRRALAAFRSGRPIGRPGRPPYLSEAEKEQLVSDMISADASISPMTVTDACDRVCSFSPHR